MQVLRTRKVSCDFVQDLKMSQTKKVESSATSSTLAGGPPSSVHDDSAEGLAQNLSLLAVISDSSLENIQTSPPAKSDGPNALNVGSGGNDSKICALAVDGKCPLGDSCLDIHGDLCAACGKYCLNPLSSEEREKHWTECKGKRASKHSQAIDDLEEEATTDGPQRDEGEASKFLELTALEKKKLQVMFGQDEDALLDPEARDFKYYLMGYEDYQDYLDDLFG